MRAISPLFTSVLLLVNISILFNFALAARYDESFQEIIDNTAAEPYQRGTLRNTLEEALRGQHQFPVQSYPSARVSPIDSAPRRISAVDFFGALKGEADQRRLVILQGPFPGDPTRKGFSAAVHVKDVSHDRHLVGFISAVDTSNAYTSERNVPKVYFHGFSGVVDAPDLKARLFSHTREVPDVLPKGHIVSFRELMDAIPGGIRG